MFTVHIIPPEAKPPRGWQMRAGGEKPSLSSEHPLPQGNKWAVSTLGMHVNRHFIYLHNKLYFKIFPCTVYDLSVKIQTSELGLSEVYVFTQNVCYFECTRTLSLTMYVKYLECTFPLPMYCIVFRVFFVTHNVYYLECTLSLIMYEYIIYSVFF